MKSFEGLQVGDLCFIRYNGTYNEGLYDLIRVVTVSKQWFKGRIIVCNYYFSYIGSTYSYDLTSDYQVIKL